MLGDADPGAGPAYRRLATQIRGAVMDGRIPSGTTLPSERSLAEATGLSRTTTTRAYEVLRESRLVRTRQGSGTVVELPVGRAGSTSMLARPSRHDGIALTAAASEAPEGFAALIQRAMTSLRHCWRPTATCRTACRSCASVSPPGTRATVCPPTRSRSSSRPAPERAVAARLGARAGPASGVLVEGCGYPHAFDLLGRAGARLLPLPTATTRGPSTRWPGSRPPPASPCSWPTSTTPPAL